MGVSTDGIIFCGWPLEEDAELPWDNEDNEDDGVEDWWRRVSGYKPLFELWTPAGEYVGGVRPPEDRMSAYGDHQREWDKANPIPFEVENYCSAECPMYAITVPGAGRRRAAVTQRRSTHRLWAAWIPSRLRASARYWPNTAWSLTASQAGIWGLTGAS